MHFNRKTIFLFIASLAMLPIAAYAFYFKQGISIKNIPQPSVVIEQSVYQLQEKIARGLKLLESTPPLELEFATIKRKQQLVRKQVALAILDIDTSTIIEKRFWVNEEESRSFDKSGNMSFKPVDDEYPVAVEIRWWNGYNTYYDIPNNPRLLVIGNKYPLPSSYLVDLPERTKKDYTDIVYVPYSKRIQTDEIVNAGKDYLNKHIEEAYQDLNKRKVRSVFQSNLPITSTVSRDLIKNIILIEHIDPKEFSLADDHGQALADRIFTIIGANGERAYRYSGSPAGANGLAQFIQPTYLSVVQRYPNAAMIKNYRLGMANHTNAVKAMVLFFDIHKKAISDQIQKSTISKQLGITEEMLAAAYNGGPSRVVSSVKKYGFAWLTGQLSGSAKPIFRQETIDYLKKFQAVQQLLNVF